MKADLSYLTLAVSEFQEALVFYRDHLQLPLQTHKDDAEHPYAFFSLGAVTLALYPEQALRQLSGLDLPRAGNRMSLSLNLPSVDAVEAMLDRARLGGATMGLTTTPPWGGYCGFLLDPFGYQWEIVWHPKYQFVRDPL